MNAAPDAGPLTLDEARALAEERQWQFLAERATGVAPEQIAEQPELSYLVADALRRTGHAPRALDLAGRAEPLARQRGDQRLVLRVINLIGIASFETGQGADAEQRFSELLEYATELGDEEFAARASNNLGVLANIKGRRDLALTCYQRALASYQRLGYQRGLAQTHHNLGISYRDLGFDREADAHYQRAIGFARDSGSPDVVALAETERAMLRVRAGDGVFGETLARRALQRFDEMADPLGRAEALRVLAAAARASGADAQAAEHLEQALVIAREHSDPLLHGEVQRDRGLLFRDQGDTESAREALLDAAEQFATLGAAAEAEAVRAIERDMSSS